MIERKGCLLKIPYFVAIFSTETLKIRRGQRKPPTQEKGVISLCLQKDYFRRFLRITTATTIPRVAVNIAEVKRIPDSTVIVIVLF
ncbi:hypothetical protein ES703_25624 [subsurface metagenome]